MNIKRLTAVRGEGRKKLFGFDNLLALIFIVIVIMSALAQGYYVFGYFSIGVIVGRIGEIIFEIKRDLFDKPFLHCILLLGIPAQLVWDRII